MILVGYQNLDCRGTDLNATYHTIIFYNLVQHLKMAFIQKYRHIRNGKTSKENLRIDEGGSDSFKKITSKNDEVVSLLQNENKLLQKIILDLRLDKHQLMVDNHSFQSTIECYQNQLSTLINSVSSAKEDVVAVATFPDESFVQRLVRKLFLK